MTNSDIGKCATCGSVWCDKHNQCSSGCHGNCKTVSQKCKNCGEEIFKYFRGNKVVWKHKNKLRYCNTQPMYISKAEPEGEK